LSTPKEAVVKMYPLGTTPTDPPRWFAEALAPSGIPASAVPMWFLDKTEGWSAPAAFLLRMPPGYRLFRHGHPCQRFEVIVQGSLDIGDGRIGKVGDVFTEEAGSLYGPHTAGPDGCTTIEIFSAIDGMFRLIYEDDQGNICEADVRKGQLPPDYVPLPMADAGKDRGG
jgi:hypothetical protein